MRDIVIQVAFDCYDCHYIDDERQNCTIFKKVLNVHMKTDKYGDEKEILRIIPCEECRKATIRRPE